MTLEHLDKIDKCRHLLPDPAPEVVGYSARTAHLDLYRRITKYQQAAGWSDAELCRRAGIAKSSWSEAKAGRKSPTFDTILKLCEPLNLRVALLPGRS